MADDELKRLAKDALDAEEMVRERMRVGDYWGAHQASINAREISRRLIEANHRRQYPDQPEMWEWKFVTPLEYVATERGDNSHGDHVPAEAVNALYDQMDRLWRYVLNLESMLESAHKLSPHTEIMVMPHIHDITATSVELEAKQ